MTNTIQRQKERPPGKARNLRQASDIDAIASTIIINILTLAMPLGMMLVFDRVVPNQSYDTLTVLFFALVAVIGIDLILKIARTHFSMSLAKKFGQDVGEVISHRLFNARLKALEKLQRESLVDRVVSIFGLRHAAKGQVVRTVIDLIFSALFIGVIWALGGWIMLAPITIAFGMICIAAYLQGKHRSASERREDNDVRRMSFLREVLINARLVKLLGVEQQMLRRYEMLQANSSKANETLIRVSDLGYTTSSIAAQVATIATCGFGAVFVINQQLGIAELAGCMLLTGRAVQPVMQLTFLSAVRNGSLRRTQRIVEIFKAPLEETPPPSNVIQNGAIELRDVAVRRTFGEGCSFKGLSAQISPGSLVAIKGPLHCNPHELLRLIAGENRPDQGEVLVDGHAASDLNASRGTGGILLEGRTPVILEGTLLENLVAFGTRLPSEDVLAVSDAIGLDQLITQIPDGLQTYLRGGGRDVSSPGLLRRIAFVRAIALRPKVLLIDQPFADLDPDGVTRMEDILSALSCDFTCILTAPTPRLERFANVIVTLHHDRDAEVIYREPEDPIAEANKTTPTAQTLRVRQFEAAKRAANPASPHVPLTPRKTSALQKQGGLENE